MKKEKIYEKTKYTREYDFVNEVADDCIANMKESSRECLIHHPCAIDYHFTYCMYIRNHYIHKRDFSNAPFYAEPDYLSSKVIQMIFSKLIPEYIYENSFIEALFENKGFIKLRKEYKKIYGEYPVELVQKYTPKMENIRRNCENEEVVIKTLMEALAEEVWRLNKIKDIVLECEIDYDEILENIEAYQQLFWKENEYVPLEVCFLPYKKKIGKERYVTYRKLLMEQLKENPRLIEKLDCSYFSDRVLAKTVLKYGWTLKYLPMYQNDETMVKYSLMQDGTAIEYASKRFQESRDWVKHAVEHSKGTIMHLDCMEPYRKDKELVYLACGLHRWNYVYVDKTFRDDFELAKICLEQVGDLNGIYSYMSKRLKGNKELAMLDLLDKHPNVKYYSAALRDDDEIAERLYELHGEDSWGWYHMSNRLKRKYHIKINE